jgi:hypothetical protein
MVCTPVDGGIARLDSLMPNSAPIRSTSRVVRQALPITGSNPAITCGGYTGGNSFKAALDNSNPAFADSAFNDVNSYEMTGVSSVNTYTVSNAATPVVMRYTNGTVYSSQQSIVSSSNQASTYTFVLTDAGTVVRSTDASSVTFTIPENVFPAGTVIEVFQAGAGTVTIAAGTGVTLLLPPNAVAQSAGQNSTIGLRQDTSNEWVLSGTLAA